MRTVLFYVSGHGYGHAVRMAEVVRALQRMTPEVRVLVRTQSPEHMFPPTVEFSCAEFDPGVVESIPGVVIDEKATRDRLLDFLGKWDALLGEEIGFAKSQRVDLIVADIPAMAGDVAAKLDVPCIAISNFTWDWIYEPYAPEHLARLEDGYRKMSVLLRLPFAQPTRLDVFRQIIDAPLVARKSVLPGKPTSGRTRVLLGSRAEIAPEALQRAAVECPDFEFMSPGPDHSFEEQFASCDMVLAKLGFSMLAECIANRKPLLYPPRESFREEGILQQNVGLHIAALAIPLEDFYAGNWKRYLEELRRQTPPPLSIRIDGAEFCAGAINTSLSQP